MCGVPGFARRGSPVGLLSRRGGIEVEGLAKHVCNAGVFFGARNVFEDVSHAMSLSEVEVLDKASDLEKGLAAWVGEAFVAACGGVWLTGRSNYDNVNAKWEV